jgi:hypothetical protein
MLFSNRRFYKTIVGAVALLATYWRQALLRRRCWM